MASSRLNRLFNADSGRTLDVVVDHGGPGGRRGARLTAWDSISPLVFAAADQGSSLAQAIEHKPFPIEQFVYEQHDTKIAETQAVTVPEGLQ